MKYWNKFENIVGVLMRSIASVCLGIVFPQHCYALTIYHL